MLQTECLMQSDSQPMFKSQFKSNQDWDLPITGHFTTVYHSQLSLKQLNFLIPSESGRYLHVSEKATIFHRSDVLADANQQCESAQGVYTSLLQLYTTGLHYSSNQPLIDRSPPTSLTVHSEFPATGERRK